MAQIKMTCECCKEVYDLPKTNEIPKHINNMRCNFCHECQDKMDDYYNEWYVETPVEIIVDPNQLTLFKL